MTPLCVVVLSRASDRSIARITGGRWGERCSETALSDELLLGMIVRFVGHDRERLDMGRLNAE